MPVGEIVPVAFESHRDALTGATVDCLTPGDHESWMPYFNQALFDGGRLLVHSDRGGATQAYLLDLSAGSMLQLTDEPGGISDHATTILPGRGAIACLAGNEVKRVDFESLAARSLYTVVPGFRGSILSASGDGSSVTFATVEKLETSTQVAGQQYSTMRETHYRRPSSVIFRVDTETGRPEAVWGEREWISHVIVSPIDADVVVFCHEGSWDRVHRLWRVRVSTGECGPVLDEPRHLTRCGHELFGPDGQIVVQYSRRMTASARDWVHYNCVTDPDGHGPRFWRFPAGMPGHVQVSRDPALLVGDRAYPQAGFEAATASLSLIRHREDEQCEVTVLCRHDTSWSTQRSHPHPVFTPDDRFVCYNSDHGGRNRVYRVPVA